MNHTHTGPSQHAFVRGIDANRDSLLFILDQYFHPQVMCAEPGGSCHRIEDTIHFLVRNLRREDELMDVSGYPDAAAHKRDHKQVLSRLDNMRDTFVCGRYDNTQVAAFLGNWARQHGLAFDRPFAAYLQASAHTVGSSR